MNIEIKVSEQSDNMTQAQSQMIKRTANVLIEHGFEVTIQWKGSAQPWTQPTIRNHPLRSPITHY
jgi:hypothetical protein